MDFERMERRHSMNVPVLPRRVIDQGLSLVLWELVGLELLDGGDSRPAVFCGCACGETCSRPCISQALLCQLEGLFTQPQGGYIPELMGLKPHVRHLSASRGQH